MPLTQEHVNKLKKIYEAQSGKTISDPEAWGMAHQLLDLYRLLLKTANKSTNKTTETGHKP